MKDGCHRKRPKDARDWPHKKTDKPPGEPKVRLADPAEVRRAQGFRAPAAE